MAWLGISIWEAQPRRGESLLVQVVLRLHSLNGCVIFWPDYGAFKSKIIILLHAYYRVASNVAEDLWVRDIVVVTRLPSLFFRVVLSSAVERARVSSCSYS